MTEKELNEVKMFSMTIEDIKKIQKEQYSYPNGSKMFATSILSDAQHMLENDDKESARQFMNIAKFLINEI